MSHLFGSLRSLLSRKSKHDGITKLWSRLRDGIVSPTRTRPRRPSFQHAACVELLETRQMLSATATTSTAPSTQFYIDPINGSNQGNGSQAHPWHTLQEVINAKLINGQTSTTGVVHAGDTINLLSGNEGAVHLYGFNNTNTITIQAYPGTQPVLNSLTVQNSSNWAFRGLTFQDAATFLPNSKLATFTNDVNIIFDHNTMSSQPNVLNWTPTDWANRGASAISFTGTGATITNNTISNVRFGIGVSGDNIIVSHNTIDDFADDGIDFTSSNTVISNNTITNHYGLLADGNHNDGIQGWTVNGTLTRNVTIDSNIVMNSNGKDANVAALATGVADDILQGISIFDGAWDNVVVTNNVVGAAAYHGIAMYGLANSVIANNIVFNESSKSSLSAWIGVFNSKTGVAPQNVVVRNNIANKINLVSVGVIDDHNLSMSSTNNWSHSAGETTALDPNKIFVLFDQVHGFYNLRLAAGSPAIGSGTILNAPVYDILGNVRNRLKEDLGAYAYSL